jgi:LAO/AO transport system kinase
VEGLKSLGPIGLDPDWDPPVARTVASTGEGVPELLASIRAHGAWLRRGDGLARKARARARLRLEALLAEEAARRAKARAGEAKVETLISDIADRKLDPYAAVDELLR